MVDCFIEEGRDDPARLLQRTELAVSVLLDGNGWQVVRFLVGRQVMKRRLGVI